MSTIPSVDLGMAAFSGIASANISIAVPVLSQNLCYVAIPDSRTGAACVWRSAVGALTPTFPTRSELMAIAHSDHTANYQKDGYAYRSTDLSNNYFVRNDKADEWAEKYADRIGIPV